MKIRYLAMLLLCFFCMSLAVLSAQSTAEEIEKLLETRAVTYGQAARFVLEAADITVLTDNSEAFRYAAGRKWLPANASADQAARLDGVSLLVMGSFGIKGGIMFSITKRPHYAYRELVYKKLIQGKADPAMNVSGERLLFITGRVLSRVDEEAAIAEERERRKIQAEEASRQRAERRQALADTINARLRERRISDTTAEATSEGVTISLSNIQFMAESAELPEAEKQKLQEIAEILKTIPARNIMVAGHTAMAGTEADRLSLSRQRAQSVASYLVMLGARSNTEITIIGYGAEISIADNTTAEGMAANRRVEIIILEN